MGLLWARQISCVLFHVSIYYLVLNIPLLLYLEKYKNPHVRSAHYVCTDLFASCLHLLQHAILEKKITIPSIIVSIGWIVLCSAW